MVIMAITIPLALLALFLGAMMLPFGRAALALEDVFIGLRKRSRVLALIATTTGALLWLALLWQLALKIAPCWLISLGLR